MLEGNCALWQIRPAGHVDFDRENKSTVITKQITIFMLAAQPAWQPVKQQLI